MISLMVCGCHYNRNNNNNKCSSSFKRMRQKEKQSRALGATQVQKVHLHQLVHRGSFAFVVKDNTHMAHEGPDSASSKLARFL